MWGSKSPMTSDVTQGSVPSKVRAACVHQRSVRVPATIIIIIITTTNHHHHHQATSSWWWHACGPRSPTSSAASWLRARARPSLPRISRPGSGTAGRISSRCPRTRWSALRITSPDPSSSSRRSSCPGPPVTRSEYADAAYMRVLALNTMKIITWQYYENDMRNRECKMIPYFHFHPCRFS